ncbi:class I SAM-dependent methyltransferase [Marinimicrobium agarilyticum]|uniref:class I SAM-dependent methyltransferase n=1 Tax=Marinimicrobium agarilyticum TaxID=306546 RepID=UPI0004180D3D|nr:class I SAM-dependent methyltransferase [Marinimicrobium agarilyticum]
MDKSSDIKKEALDPKELAKHLRQPQGSIGLEVGTTMNTVNAGVNRACHQLLALEGSDRVLELGPANGRFVSELLQANPGITYTGVDWSDDMVAEAERTNAEWVATNQARFLQGNSDNLPFPDNTFDKVLAVNTLYFWDKPADHLAQVARVMRPGGLFCLAFGDRSFMETLAFTAYGFMLYDRQSATALLERNGLRVVEAQEYREMGKSNTGEPVEKFGHALVCTI